MLKKAIGFKPISRKLTLASSGFDAEGDHSCSSSYSSVHSLEANFIVYGSRQLKTVFATQSGTEQLKVARDVFRRIFLVQLLTLNVSVISVTTNGHVVWLQIPV